MAGVDQWSDAYAGGGIDERRGIDHKATVAADMARAAAFQVIITKKVVDLGLVSADKADAFRQELAKKKHLGGAYAAWPVVGIFHQIAARMG